MNTPFLFFKETGIVEESCWPYSSGSGKVEYCRFSCKNGARWKTYKIKAFRTFPGMVMIKQELFQNGPMNTGFDVYSDFMNYKVIFIFFTFF